MNRASTRQIADGVVSLLNDETFTPAFTAERVVTADFDLSELNELKVVVVAGSSESGGGANRSGTPKERTVQVGVLKRVTSDDEADALGDLVDAIAEHLDNRPLNAVNARWLRTEHATLMDADLLRRKKVYLGVVLVTYLAV
ncbi:MAG: hypothetical protein AAGI68_15980 [Planctomycetota bacterium]